MSQSYRAQKIYDNDRERQAQVQSNNCQYTVWLSGNTISLIGPGVNESSAADEFPIFDSFEDLAVQVVLLFENGLWPKA